MSSQRRIGYVLSFVVLGTSLVPVAAVAAPLRCDSNTALTLIGLDTKARRALFAPPPAADGSGWMFEVDLANETATAWPDAEPTSRFGGSTGPGPVIASSRCGDRCIQPVVFRRGGWERLGEPLLASGTMTVHSTWDRAGTPWVVLHALGSEAGVAAKAYRLSAGDWVSEGGLSVRGVGSPGAYPAPVGEEGIVTGDGLFQAGRPPRRWLEALPPVAGAEPGELIWSGGGQVVHVGADGAVRSSVDGGKRWEELRWQPWSGGEGDLAWRRGRDWWIELPEGERGAPPVAVWNDRRLATRLRLFLAQREPSGAWRLLLETPQGLLTEGGERLPYNHLFRFAADRWVLVTGCISRRDGVAIALRSVHGTQLQPPNLVAVEPAAPPTAPPAGEAPSRPAPPPTPTPRPSGP
jgi:hypothetical protein